MLPPAKLHALKKLLPGRDPGRAAIVNLNEAGVKWCDEHGLASTPTSPLIEPGPCAEMVVALHRRLGVEWTLGGYLEERSSLWKGSYLEESGNFIHLGVDINVAAGTAVALSFPGKIVLADHDRGVNWGWGPRLIVRPLAPAAGDVLMIYAHLDTVDFAIGQSLSAGTILGRVGKPPDNGNWFPHLHVQGVKSDIFETYLRQGIEGLDGYGHPRDIEQLRKDYPDPLAVLEALS